MIFIANCELSRGEALSPSDSFATYKWSFETKSWLENSCNGRQSIYSGNAVDDHRANSHRELIYQGSDGVIML